MTRRALAALPLLAVPLMGAAGLPQRAAGLWSMDMVTGPMHMTSTACVDPASERSDAMLGQQRRGGMDCSPPVVGPAPGGVSFANTCRTHGMTVATHGTATGDFRTAYVIKTSTTMSPAPAAGMGAMGSVITARRIGPCPAGMKGGAVTLNGRTISRPH